MRFLFFFAALWSAGAGLWILLTTQTMHSIEATSTAEEPDKPGNDPAGLFTSPGSLGVFILIVFAALYCLSILFPAQ
jgi:hypothetical protein